MSRRRYAASRSVSRTLTTWPGCIGDCAPGLPMWVVYRPVTREYPGVWVARMHVTLCRKHALRTRFVMTHDSLDELRSLLPPALTWMERNPQDVPEIEEVWL